MELERRHDGMAAPASWVWAVVLGWVFLAATAVALLENGTGPS